MDLVSNPAATRVVVTMEHTDKKGNPKIVNQCTFPLTGRACVSRIITELVSVPLFPSYMCSSATWQSLMLFMYSKAVFDVDFSHGLHLIEVGPGVTVEELGRKTGAPFTVAKDLKTMI